MDFPQYRKLSNGLAYYKILDEKSFEELQIVGNKVVKHFVKAQKYPEMLKIKDLLSDKNRYLNSTDKEYDAIQ